MIPAKGTTRHGRGKARFKDKRRAVVIFDMDQFDEIRAWAVREGTSFAEAVRVLTEWGLEAEPP